MTKQSKRLVFAHTCDMLELSGLLHDLGMLKVPDKILHKPGKLVEVENFIVRRHSYNTYEILKRIKGFEDISMWAAQHHERSDGSQCYFKRFFKLRPLRFSHR
jgi:HD-GYP domain-containing protein (c-di-GMP phosphodiesterase class II)